MGKNKSNVIKYTGEPIIVNGALGPVVVERVRGIETLRVPTEAEKNSLPNAPITLNEMLGKIIKSNPATKYGLENFHDFFIEITRNANGTISITESPPQQAFSPQQSQFATPPAYSPPSAEYLKQQQQQKQRYSPAPAYQAAPDFPGDRGAATGYRQPASPAQTFDIEPNQYKYFRLIGENGQNIIMVKNIGGKLSYDKLNLASDELKTFQKTAIPLIGSFAEYEQSVQRENQSRPQDQQMVQDLPPPYEAGDLSQQQPTLQQQTKVEPTARPLNALGDDDRRREQQQRLNKGDVAEYQAMKAPPPGWEASHASNFVRTEQLAPQQQTKTEPINPNNSYIGSLDAVKANEKNLKPTGNVPGPGDLNGFKNATQSVQSVPGGNPPKAQTGVGNPPKPQGPKK